jgi:hypothetical protein
MAVDVTGAQFMTISRTMCFKAVKAKQENLIAVGHTTGRAADDTSGHSTGGALIGSPINKHRL